MSKKVLFTSKKVNAIIVKNRRLMCEGAYNKGEKP